MKFKHIKTYIESYQKIIFYILLYIFHIMLYLILLYYICHILYYQLDYQLEGCKNISQYFKKFKHIYQNYVQTK